MTFAEKLPVAQLAVESNKVDDSSDEVDSSYICQQESLK